MYKVDADRVWYNGVVKEGKNSDVDLLAKNAYWIAPILAEKKLDDKTVDSVKYLLMQTGEDDAAWYAWVEAEHVSEWEAPKDEPVLAETEFEVVTLEVAE